MQCVSFSTLYLYLLVKRMRSAINLYWDDKRNAKSRRD